MPEPQSPHTIRVGTASWTDPTLIKSGRFYPKGCTTAEARLRFYASRFSLVEVNSSYYALPAPETAQLWALRTPDDFTFNVKAFRLFTAHQTPLVAMPPPIREALGARDKPNIYYADMPDGLLDETWRLFEDTLAPLRHARKLGAVHFQFAPWLVYSPAARAHVQECRSRLPDATLSVEFRHQSWFSERHRERTLAFLRELGLVHTVLDAPQGFDNSVPGMWSVTNPRLALVRLHGRNAATWNAKGLASASDRFNYDYSDTELEALATPIARLAAEVQETHVVFNNNMEDQGQRNASRLRELLSTIGSVR
ncbi:MAG TPA: DUF72 domain-containing protein [Caldimonas sp.]|nr:DUF72 domain-containing protein [Caldimonas sp.]